MCSVQGVGFQNPMYRDLAKKQKLAELLRLLYVQKARSVRKIVSHK